MNTPAVELTLQLIRSWLFVKRFVDAACQTHQLSMSSYFALVCIAESKETGISLTEVLSMTGISRANARLILDELEKQALVQKEPHPSDRRAVTLKVLPAGKVKREKIDQDIETRMSVVLSSVSRDQMVDLSQRLGSLVTIDEISRIGLSRSGLL